MKKKVLTIVLVLILLAALSACGASKTSTNYSDLVGPWQLDSRYIDGNSQTIVWTILYFKSDKTVDIYEYPQQATVQTNSFAAKKEYIPDKSLFTLMGSSPVTVNGNTISYQYNGATITGKFTIDLNSYTMHLYIDNTTNNVIHEIYKT
ncbi:MAG: hypothetical protein GYA50_07915, partial [Eubacteriaceae bacterium]|nr:hypothetical protein [Eubacteriaceae bacterium]